MAWSVNRNKKGSKPENKNEAQEVKDNPGNLIQKENQVQVDKQPETVKPFVRESPIDAKGKFKTAIFLCKKNERSRGTLADKDMKCIHCGEKTILEGYYEGDNFVKIKEG